MNLLDSHPDLAVYPTDANYLYAYFPTFTRGDFDNTQRKARFDRVVFTELQTTLESWGRTKDVDVPQFRNLFFSKVEGQLGNIAAINNSFQESYKEVMKQQGLPFVMKESSVEIYASEILESQPSARIVHLIRDPRDNFAALKAGVSKRYAKMGEGVNETLASLLHRARLGFQYALANQEFFGEERYHIVKFEELVGNSDSTLSTLCDFLSITPSETLKVPTKLGYPTKGNNYDGIDFSALSAKNVGRWRERIKPEEAQIIEFHFGELLEYFGYNRHFPLKEQARAASDFYKWSNYKYFYSDRFT